MPRTYLVFGDIEGKLDVLRIACTKCDRKGLYLVRKLIAKHGRKGNMSAWLSDLKGDCPKRDRRLNVVGARKQVRQNEKGATWIAPRPQIAPAGFLGPANR